MVTDECNRLGKELLQTGFESTHTNINEERLGRSTIEITQLA